MLTAPIPTGGDGAEAVLQRGDVLLQGRDGGIADAGVDVALLLAGEERRAVGASRKAKVEVW